MRKCQLCAPLTSLKSLSARLGDVIAKTLQQSQRPNTARTHFSQVLFFLP